MYIFNILISLILALGSLSAVPQKGLPTTTHQAPQSNVQRSEPKKLDDQGAAKPAPSNPSQQPTVCQDGSIDMGGGVCRFYTGCEHGDSLDKDKCDAMGF